MATSSKVMFDLEQLRKQALDSMDDRISEQERIVEAFSSEEQLSDLIEVWRIRQQEKVTALFHQLEEVSDHQLAAFKIDSVPEINRWERRDALTRLNLLREKRSQIIAKSSSLVADADGKIALTKTQLSEFFGL